MSTLTPVPITLPKDKVPTKAIVSAIISTFLPLEWPSVDPESLTMTYHASYANSHCTVQRPPPSNITKPPTEPLKVFIKFHNSPEGSMELFRPLAPTRSEEAIFCDEFSRSGLGARVYGFFETRDGTLGRIDEFLDARNLEPEDVEDEVVRADVARGLAMFHTLETAVKKKDVGRYYAAVIDGLGRYHKMEKLKRLGKEGGVKVDDLIDYDFGGRLRKVVNKLELIGGKTGWCIHDIQFMNIMVHNNPQEKSSKIALIDFEFVMRNYRAFDIGGHFMQKMFKWFDEDSRIAKCEKYTEEEKRHFCEMYARRWNEVTGETDTGEQVFREAEYGFLLAVTFDVHNMLWYMNKTDDRDPLNLLGLMKLYEEFVDQYDKLDLGDP